jgi:hypothetical protein
MSAEITIFIQFNTVLDDTQHHRESQQADGDTHSQIGVKSAQKAHHASVTE